MTDRKSRGKTQKIYLIDYIESDSKFITMGTTGNVYTVQIDAEPSCTCPDYLTRHIRCKHIYFILLRVMLVDESKVEQKKYSNQELNLMFHNIPDMVVDQSIRNNYINMKNSGGNKTVAQRSLDDDICPVCLDNMDTDDDIVFCRYSCGKSIHEECFTMWTKNKPKKTCVFCAQLWDKKDEEYINLINTD